MWKPWQAYKEIFISHKLRADKSKDEIHILTFIDRKAWEQIGFSIPKGLLCLKKKWDPRTWKWDICVDAFENLNSNACFDLQKYFNSQRWCRQIFLARKYILHQDVLPPALLATNITQSRRGETLNLDKKKIIYQYWCTLPLYKTHILARIQGTMMTYY